jgi:hypothetical protein
MLHAYQGYAGVTLEVRTDDDNPNDDHGHTITLRDGSIVRNLRGRRGTQRRFRIVVPRDTEELTIRTLGGRGDADLYLRRGAAPTAADYQYRSVGKYTSETIRVSDPPAGTWYVLLKGYQSFSGVTITASLEEDDGRGWGDGGDWNWGDDDDDDGLARRWIRVTEPDARERWRIGQRVTIRWQAAGRVDRVWVYYSLNDGRNWTRLGRRSVDADDGRMTIVLPNNERFVTRTARIRVVDADRPAVRATSGRFRVLGDDRDDDDRWPRPRPRGDRYEPDGSILRATRLQVGQTQTHTINPAGDHDWFLIPAALPGRYTVHIPATTTELRAKAYRNDGRQNHSAGSFKDLRTGGSLTLTATRGTKYFLVRIYGEERSDRGTYRLTVTAVRRRNVDDEDDRGRRPRPRRPRRPRANIRLGVTQNRRIDEDWEPVRFVPDGNGAYAFRVQTDEELEAELWIDNGNGLRKVRNVELDEGVGTVGFLARRRVTRNVVLKLRTEEDDDTASVKVRLTRVGWR